MFTQKITFIDFVIHQISFHLPVTVGEGDTSTDTDGSRDFSFLIPCLMEVIAELGITGEYTVFRDKLQVVVQFQIGSRIP